MHLRQTGLQLRRSDEIGALELAPQKALVNPQEEHLPRPFVDRVPVGARPELRAQRDELLVLGRMTEKDVAKAPVERLVEVLRRERRELRDERRVTYDCGE